MAWNKGKAAGGRREEMGVSWADGEDPAGRQRERRAFKTAVLLVADVV